MLRYIIYILLTHTVSAWAYPTVSITTNEWWDYAQLWPRILKKTMTRPAMGEYTGAAAYVTDFAFWSDDGRRRVVWTYRGNGCLSAAPTKQDVYDLVDMAVPSSRESLRPGVVDTGGHGHMGQCREPEHRMIIDFSVGPTPPSPPPPLACRLDAETAMSIVAPPGRSRRPVVAAVVCTGDGEASAVVRSTSPHSVIVADGVTVVLNGQLDKPTPVQGGSSLPIDLHVDVENNHGVPGGYSVSYVLTVDLT